MTLAVRPSRSGHHRSSSSSPPPGGYSLSDGTVHINLHYHNPYNVPDHLADVAAA